MDIEKIRAEFEKRYRSKYLVDDGMTLIYYDFRNSYERPDVDWMWSAYQAALESPEVQALRRDAERYTWLKHGDNDEKVLCNGPVDKTYWYLPRMEKLDQAIDSAMSK